MSSYRLTPPPRARLSWLYVLAGFAVAAALVAVVAAAPRPIHVTVDGVDRQVDDASVVGDVAVSMLDAKPGDLLAVDGSILKQGGGQPPVTMRDGRRVTSERRLYDGDVITSRPGADITERSMTETLPVAFATQIVGSGPISRVATEGVPGVRRVTKGENSGIILSDTVLRKPVDQVVVKQRPAPGAKLVALTFDDGPWPGQTERVLDILKNYNVPATFFVVGSRVSRAPGIVHREVAEGHLVGNHSLSHKLLTKLKRKQIHKEIQHGAERIARIPGTKPRWLRPPYGAMNGKAWREARALDARVVLWDVDSQDWRHPGTKRIVRNVVGNVRPGSIVLMHDGGGKRGQTVGALPGIIEDLKAKGYIFVTVEDLVAAN